MEIKKKQARLKRYLERISPIEATLEKVSIREGTLESLGDGAVETESRDAKAGLELILQDKKLSPTHLHALEAIILPGERPVVDIRHGTFEIPEEPFAHFGTPLIRLAIEKVLPAIGRMELPGHPTLPYGGTGFVVGENLLMTNRHVAEIFTNGIGREGLSFRNGSSAGIDFLKEVDSSASQFFTVDEILMVHPYWDMALLSVQGLEDIEPLNLMTTIPRDLHGREVAVIGYPAMDPRNEVELQNRIFRNRYNVKRLQPGKFRGVKEIDSYGHQVAAITHDSSTLGGNSGSAVIDVRSGMVAALHFAGIYLKANYAVPAYDLSQDGRVVESGVQFDGEPQPGDSVWEKYWSMADPVGKEGFGSKVAGIHAADPVDILPGTSATWTVPLEITVSVGDRTRISIDPGKGGVLSPGTAVIDLQEKIVEPYHDKNYRNRTGYNDGFLGVDVPLPEVGDDAILSRLEDGETIIPYQNFSLVMHKMRRLALFTAANIDGDREKRKPEPGKKYTRKALSRLGENDREKWFTDNRIPAAHQLPDVFYTRDNKAFDKGHIIRRDDMTWGASYAEIERANGDTFHVTNCSPQVKGFNRATFGGLWGKLENLVLRSAKNEQSRYSILAGPALTSQDRFFVGVDDHGGVRIQIPERYWKMVLFNDGGTLKSFAFLLEQDLSDIDLEFMVEQEWRNQMISIADLESLVGLFSFPAVVHDADQFETTVGEMICRTNGLKKFGGRTS